MCSLYQISSVDWEKHCYCGELKITHLLYKIQQVELKEKCQNPNCLLVIRPPLSFPFFYIEILFLCICNKSYRAYIAYREIPYIFSGTQLKKYYLKYIFTANDNIKWKTFCLISSSSPTTFKVRIGPCYFLHTCKTQKPVFRTPGDFPAGKSHYAVRMFLLPAVGSIYMQNKKNASFPSIFQLHKSLHFVNRIRFVSYLLFTIST